MPDNHPQPIVLASASPRRRQILTLLSIPFTIDAADLDEKAIQYTRPRELALKAAFLKAGAVGKRHPEGTIIIAADTIVVLAERVYNKPESEEEARQFLSELAGRPHKVITGIAVHEAGKSTLVDAVETQVHIKPLTPEQIAEYVATGEPMDKAGAYAAQGRGRQLIERVDGDFFNVVGLPTGKMLDMLSNYLDVKPYRFALKKLTPDAFDAHGELADK